MKLDQCTAKYARKCAKHKDVYNLGALVVTIESSLYTFAKLQNNEKW